MRLLIRFSQAFVSIGILAVWSGFADSAQVSSPDGQVRLRVDIKEKLDPYPGGRRLYYSVSFKGKEVILDSPWGIDFRNQAPIARDLRIVSQERRTEDTEWENHWGKCRRVRNHFNEISLLLEEENSPGRRVDLRFRAYDDGVAFRYGFPEQEAIREFRLESERSEFHFAENHTVWAADYGEFVSHQESEFLKRRLNDFETGDVIGVPLLVKIDEEHWLALTEANLTDWAGMYLTGLSSSPNSVVSMLSPLPDQPGIAVVSSAPRYSPWRVILVGTSAGALIESDLILNLNDSCAIEDPSWIVSGRSAWDRWWSGDYAPDADFKIGMNTETMKYFTEFAGEMGWEYILVDWHWYGDPLDPGADITTPVAELDLPELLEFAKLKRVRVLVWLRWNHARDQMEKAFPLYEKWGVAGVKVDFMQRDDQEMVNFYHRLVKLAAEHHLVVDFHGAYKPTGFRRTYPNLLTREGVLGNEYNKWSSRVTPEHNVTIPFTRMLAGPIDFTPGGFRHRSQKDFVPQDSAPYVMGTRSHQLAMMVVYESPLQVLCDSPYNYRGQAGLDFLKSVPTTWDETSFLAGSVGEYIVLARRLGKEWFLGAMNGPEGREFVLPLRFLGEGQYAVQIYSDAPDSDDYPERLEEKWQYVTSSDTLKLRLVAGGGSAAHFTQVQK